MRLTPQEIDAIRTAAHEAFGAGAVVRLFGSRVDDRRRGGDIDLHFEVSALPALKACTHFLDRVEAATDGRKIDTVFSIRGMAPRGFEQIAYRDGIIL